ncbi:RNA polymerase sigma-70 factor (ECF subfamily) [Azospirillum brasilense]|uniref:RNA polymerase sigma-70 factor (ECF subfamily) n=1 Tax=Azospirillum brasilense TaxID=192 RepID=A0A560C5Z9_AZOBR|nr:sigma-70 family RNA polymerase sigma factor [Azospirillum brasilense]MBK3733341.1 sigma-70 family RNA polymerase sigma factor [Azospirillum brasilense]TWA80279.1 RNA polymerase sigma-70 factor (ECF subfamily) [Azospirillum brasilense]
MSASLIAIYLDHRRSLFGCAMKIVRDFQIAEDVLQESYLRACKAVERGPIDNVGAFLHRTVHNLALDHLRRCRTQERFEAGPADTAEALGIASETPSAEERLLHRERVSCFMDALDRLPARARQVWLLNRVEGLSYPQIAAHLGVSPGTVFNDMKLAMGHFVDAMARRDRSGATAARPGGTL